MNSSLQHYFDSLTPQKSHWFSFLIDGGMIIILLLLGIAFTTILNAQAVALGATSTEQLQQLLLSQPEQAQDIVLQLRSYVLFFLIGGLLFLLVTLALSSLSQALIWNILTRRKLSLKSYGKWNLFHLALLIPLLFILLLYLIIRIGINTLLPLIVTNQNVYAIGSQFITALFGVFFLLWYFSSCYSFTATNNVWESLGKSFSLMKDQFFSLFTFSLLTIILLALLLLPFQNYFFLYPQRGLYVQGAVFLLFLAWMRVYLVCQLTSEKT